MSYREIVVGLVVTLLVSVASAANESTKAPAVTGTASRSPAQSAAKPATSPATETSTPAASATKPPTSANAKPGKTPAKPQKKIDLNNATLAELKTLPTVTEADAKKIIANRPYKSKGELVTKAGLPEGVYHAVRDKVELQKPRTSAPKK